MWIDDDFFFGCCCFWCCGCLIGWLVILNTCVNFKCAKNQLTNNYLRNLISYLSIIKYRLLAYISPKRMVSNVDNETLLKTIKWLSTKNPPRKKNKQRKVFLKFCLLKKQQPIRFGYLRLCFIVVVTERIKKPFSNI